MSFKAVLRSIFFLLILFIMLYVGMNNTQRIDFRFPGVLKETLTAAAGLIYFGVFAVGVIAGTILTAGSGGGRKSGGASREK
ncbi:MAG TPA: hypothetical protein VHV47_15230 [Opitutaceae bacterium]|jgi:uncharacterized integral membrane protein|nr:hypothetical protein [Opitutaceae bacterium]